MTKDADHHRSRPAGRSCHLTAVNAIEASKGNTLPLLALAAA